MLFVSERWRRFVEFDRMASIIPAEEISIIEKSCMEVLESARRRCDQIIDGLLRIYCRGKRDCVSKIARNITLESYEHNKKLAVYMREISPAEKIHANLDSVDRMACDVRADLLSR
ncbi:hypothetical protein COOONC_21670 [Cooperia oncophora]